MKRIIKMLVLAICMCLCLCSCEGPTEGILKKVQTYGVRVNHADFMRAYCGRAEDRIPVEECESYSAISAQLLHVVVTKDCVSMLVSVTDDAQQTTNQTLNGEWRNGMAYETHGENSITVKFEQTEEANLRPLVFNCYNDTKFNNLLLGKVPDEAPHLKFYLTDRAGNIILLEGTLPRLLQRLPNESWETDDSDTTALIRYVNRGAGY